MAAIAPSIYAAIVTSLGFACFALSATAVGLPVWGRFRNTAGTFPIVNNIRRLSNRNSYSLLLGYEDQGYFGPWKICRQLSYSYREKCGPEVSYFRPSRKCLR